MLQLLKIYNFKPLGSCNCGGTRNDKFYNGRFTLYIQPKRYQFKLKEDGSTIVPLQPIQNLESQLIKHGFKKTIPAG